MPNPWPFRTGKKVQDDKKPLMGGETDENQGVYEDDPSVAGGIASSSADTIDSKTGHDVGGFAKPTAPTEVYEDDVASGDSDDPRRTVSGASKVSIASGESSDNYAEPEFVNGHPSRDAPSPLDGITTKEQLEFLAGKGYGRGKSSTATESEITSGDSVENYKVPMLAKGGLENEYQDPELAAVKKPEGKAGQVKANPVRENDGRVYE